MESTKKQLIVLTGKETKSQLVKLLVENKAKESYSKDVYTELDCDFYFRKDSKPELLKKIKMFNTNCANGGNGNISFYNNEEGFQPRNEVKKRFDEFLFEQGILENDFIKKFGYYLTKQMNDESSYFFENSLNGVIGNADVEIMLNKMIEIYNIFSKR